MKCQYCGCEIEEGVKFCTNCGAKVDQQPEPVVVGNTEPKAEPQPEPVVVGNTEPKAEPQPEPVVVGKSEPQVEPQPQQDVKPTPPPRQDNSSPQFNPQPNAAPQPPKKENKGLKIFLIVLAVIAVLFGGCTIIGGLVAKKTVDNVINNPSDYFDDDDFDDDDVDFDDDQLYDSYMYGGLFKDGKLQYGPAIIDLSGYALYEYTEDGETEPSEWYLVDNADNVQALVYVLQQYEYNVSYSNTKEEDIRDSYTEDDGWTNVKMLSFEKTKVGDYPCIIYSASATNNGTDEYILECILFDEDNASETVRILGECGEESAYKDLLERFNNVKLASNPVTWNDTGTFTWEQITQK